MHASFGAPPLAIIRKPKPPAKHAMVNTGLYLPEELLAEVDLVRSETGHTKRNPVLVDLIRAGLAAYRRDKARKRP